VNVGGTALKEVKHPVSFIEGKSTIFGSEDISETRYVPWVIKEHSFKHAAGYMGAAFVGSMWPLGYTLCSIA
jgi:hypothetical protein